MPRLTRVSYNSCGWGSAALYFAELFPKSLITAFSNSKTQKVYIESKAEEKGIRNIIVVTGNVVDYEFEPDTFDRVISIEVCHQIHSPARSMPACVDCGRQTA